MPERRAKTKRNQDGASDDRAEQPTKSERRAARGRSQRERSTAGAEDSPQPETGVEERLAKIEAAVASQAKRSEELLGKLDEVLEAARKSASDADSAAGESS